MLIACRDRLAFVTQAEKGRRHPDAPAHAGLLLDRYLTNTKEGSGPDPQAKRRLLDHARAAGENAMPIYRLAFDRWKRSLPTHPEPKVFQVEGRLIVGLGNENVLESGITLHHAYGTPIIPGSALKGLASHYCDCVWGHRPHPDQAPAQDEPSEDQKRFRQCRDGEDPNDVGLYHRILFGTTEDRGHIIFHDAWIDPDSLNRRGSGLVLDILTPHHSGYYSGKERGSDRAAPTDFDDPNPVSFLSVAGRFLVCVSGDEDESRPWAELAYQLLTESLQHWGIGGKTSSGYGRMS